MNENKIPGFRNVFPKLNVDNSSSIGVDGKVDPFARCVFCNSMNKNSNNKCWFCESNNWKHGN